MSLSRSLSTSPKLMLVVGLGEPLPASSDSLMKERASKSEPKGKFLPPFPFPPFFFSPCFREKNKLVLTLLFARFFFFGAARLYNHGRAIQPHLARPGALDPGLSASPSGARKATCEFHYFFIQTKCRRGEKALIGSTLLFFFISMLIDADGSALFFFFRPRL